MAISLLINLAEQENTSQIPNTISIIKIIQTSHSYQNLVKDLAEKYVTELKVHCNTTTDEDTLICLERQKSRQITPETFVYRTVDEVSTLIHELFTQILRLIEAELVQLVYLSYQINKQKVEYANIHSQSIEPNKKLKELLNKLIGIRSTTNAQITKKLNILTTYRTNTIVIEVYTKYFTQSFGIKVQ